MRALRVTAKGGDEWQVRAFRVRLRWRQVDIWGDSQWLPGGGDGFTLVLGLAALPFTLILIPLVLALLELPVSIARAALSDTIWVQAETHFPTVESYLWRTTRVDATGGSGRRRRPPLCR